MTIVCICLVLYLMQNASCQQVEEREYSRTMTLADEVYRQVQNKTQDERILEATQKLQISFQILEDDPRADHRVSAGGGNTRVEHRQGYYRSYRVSGRVTFPDGSQFVPRPRTFRENYRETNGEQNFGNKFLSRILKDNRIRIDSSKQDGGESEAVKAVSSFANDIATETIRRFSASGTQATVERSGADVEGIDNGEFEVEVIRPEQQPQDRPVHQSEPTVFIPAYFTATKPGYMFQFLGTGGRPDNGLKCTVKVLRYCGNNEWTYEALYSHNSSRPGRGDKVVFLPARR